VIQLTSWSWLCKRHAEELDSVATTTVLCDRNKVGINCSWDQCEQRAVLKVEFVAGLLTVRELEQFNQWCYREEDLSLHDCKDALAEPL